MFSNLWDSRPYPNFVIEIIACRGLQISIQNQKWQIEDQHKNEQLE